MKKILSALACTACMIAAIGMFSPTNVEAASDTQYEWATLSIVAGIAVCDGPSDNCTKPVRKKATLQTV